MKNKSINKEEFLAELKRAVNDFSEDSIDLKCRLIENASELKLNSATQLSTLHDVLLFISAYPQNERMVTLAEQELRSLTQQIEKNKSLSEKLGGSGLAGTKTCGAFSLTLTRWLLANYPGTVFFHSFGEGVHPKEILKHGISEMEFEMVSDEDTKPEKWLIKFLGTKKRDRMLMGLVENMINIPASSLIIEQLYESMQVFVEIKPNSDLFSRTFGKIEQKKCFYHKGPLLKKFNERELIDKKLPPAKKLKYSEKIKILDASKTALALLNRETDPITYCEPDAKGMKHSDEGFLFFELEHGLSIALFSINAERRLPLESYIGFMMFKNGFPTSYGGAWLFEKRALIGINIFEAFRGGESAFIFAQLLRCYRQAFGATYFEVEPYQFGKHNPEGISSGAFWFYHRFGFRPVNKKLNEMAEKEHQLILSQKGYRTSVQVLKKFTGSNMFANFKGQDGPMNPSNISKFITEKINKEFKGNRERAIHHSTLFLKRNGITRTKKNLAGFNKLSLFVLFCLDQQKLNRSYFSQINGLFIAKSASEFEYIRLLHLLKIEDLYSKELKEFCLKP